MFLLPAKLVMWIRRRYQKSREECSHIDALDKEISCAEETQRDKAGVAGCDGESLPNGEHLSDNKDIKEEKASDVAEIASAQVHGDEDMVPHIAEEKLIGDAAANESYAVVTPESPVGKTGEVVATEVALPDDVKVSGTTSEMLESSSTLISCTTSVENTGSLEVEESVQNVESFTEESPRRDECASPQTVKDEPVSVQVDKDESMNSLPVEGNLREEAREIPTSLESDMSQTKGSHVQVVSGTDSCHDFVSAGPLGNDKSNSETDMSVSYTPIGEEQKVGTEPQGEVRTESQGVDNSTLIDNSLVSQHEEVSGEQTVIMNNLDTSEIGDGISEINAVEGNTGLVNESHRLEDEVLDRSTDSCLHEHSSIEENAHAHADEMKHASATEVVLSATSEVGGEGELNPPLVEDSQNMEASVPVDLDVQVKFANECPESVSAAFIPSVDESDSTPVIAAASDSEKDVTMSEVELAKELGLDGEGQELANESVRVEGELEITDLPKKESQQVVEQVAAKEELSMVKDEVSVADDIDCTSPDSEKSQMSEDTAVGSAEALPNGGLSSPRNIPEKGVEQESEALGNEVVPCEDIKTNTYAGEENRDEGTFNVHSENEPVSAFAAESIGTLEVRDSEGCTLSNPGENADDFETDNASIKQHEQQIAESHVSEFGDPQVDETGQMVTEDLESFPEAEGVLNADDDVLKEDDITQLYEFVDTECSVPEHFDDNAVGGIKQVFPDENKDSEIAFQDGGFIS
ncbi:hypothetical protein Syun_016047 [Stephania yunnanensis]|uniref:Uncharacterized protein n=1 Tax=Stephania yunnanensis TaxID=152371 RepID=A0AAP0J571_9MAGN